MALRKKSRLDFIKYKSDFRWPRSAEVVFIWLGSFLDCNRRLSQTYNLQNWAWYAQVVKESFSLQRDDISHNTQIHAEAMHQVGRINIKVDTGVI